MPLPLIPIGAAIAEMVLPKIGKWIAGDKGEKVAGQVVGVAQAVTGTGSPEQALEALRASTEMQAKLQERLIDLEADLEKAYLADRADARARDVAIRASGQTNWRADALAILVVVGVVTIPVLLIFVSVPEGPGRDLLMVMAGVLGKALGDIIHFEFGSSRGSKDKNSLISTTKPNG